MQVSKVHLRLERVRYSCVWTGNQFRFTLCNAHGGCLEMTRDGGKVTCLACLKRMRRICEETECNSVRLLPMTALLSLE